MADTSAGIVEKSEPAASRPQMPKAYGIPKARKGMLEWSRARELLASARNYWVCTTRPDGRPHSVPVWGVWLDNDTFYCGGDPETRWVRNLKGNPAAAMHIEIEGIAIMVEGDCKETHPDPETAAKVDAEFEAKYKFRPNVAEGVFLMRPRLVFGWDESLKGAARWQFGG